MNRFVRILRRAGLALVLPFALAASAQAETLTVAVAANFKKPAEEIGAAFKAKTGDEVKYAFGATGQFAAQIRNGAPFDILLAADDTTAPALAKDGLALASSNFVYARGTLVLYSTTLPLKEQGEQILRKGDFAHVSIANPKTAPYGTAAIEAMKKMGVYDALKPKIVEGSNIGQTFDFVATGNAQAGFVALSQAIGAGKGQWWVVPQADYAPIDQSAILLKPGENKAVAKAYLDFLRGPEARTVIEKYGYTIPR
ncbi:MAG TPA: molybdate ABC transporter substrate-binding protein [Thiomonas arsenitoxydans]|jgi:molybdate transport system substrate-binding protein|uniref:molybdate ABC transporter substrate-binding protein n=1 Tax=unclassified Thiomonas TaxID=2625466 RepID=UPI000BC8A983|nr:MULTISPECIES: molybdate ABC transporter substrate-binding protein [unclassified Thiomonas]MDE1980215.1 molybdate ABC transporter substrate-binding protein [Betaproteobacteria bacterium]OYV30512.1 MAG: molybdate ABC transporter substrate-binding protein [Thiomonas sp. 20-64-9]OZB69531.1 MAG: molybdate ABC transporter substrate-binding protein [Thiomonas sp. 13-64-67]HOI66357.1 molybdate ABC transporter substrate-binding protein [Thiomonas arsenitoxydans]